MTKAKNEGRTGSGAKNTKNFVFAALSPAKKENDKNEEEAEAPAKTKKRAKSSSGNQQMTKRTKVDRAIDENSMDTIFGFM